MAVNIDEMINNLLEFHSFDNKTVISMGAGGRQFIEYGRRSKRVIAIDNSLYVLTAIILRLGGFSWKIVLYTKVKHIYNHGYG